MIIVWRGLGILVLIILGGVLVATQIAISAMTGDPTYFEVHAWPKMVGCGIAAGLILVVSNLRSRNGAGGVDTLFFIPMWIWAFVILAGGLLWTASTGADRLAAESAQPGTVSAREPASPRTQQVEQTPGTPATTQARPTRLALAPGELRLQGIIYIPGNRGTAEISDRAVAAGDQILGYTVLSIEQQVVTLRSADGKLRALRLANTGR